MFLTPRSSADPPLPWAQVDALAADETLKSGGRARRTGKARRAQKTHTAWVVFVMAFGIAFGIGQDRQLRRELGSKLRVTTAHAAAAVARHVNR